MEILTTLANPYVRLSKKVDWNFCKQTNCVQKRRFTAVYFENYSGNALHCFGSVTRKGSPSLNSFFD